MRFSKDRTRKISAVFSLLVALEIICAAPLTLAQSQSDKSIIGSFITRQAKESVLLNTKKRGRLLRVI